MQKNIAQIRVHKQSSIKLPLQVTLLEVKFLIAFSSQTKGNKKYRLKVFAR